MSGLGNNTFKRVFDLFFSAFALVLFSPFALLIACAIKLESRGPVVFRQMRAGLNGHPFEIYKFRTMRLHDDAPEVLGPIKHNHHLVTRTGYFLRRFKLDEFPQFLNVLKGEMSVVGPRPCLISTFECLPVEEKLRFSVKPGVTGWAEVNGNVELRLHEQVMLDIWYVYHQSMMLDMRIIIKTMTTIFVGSVRNEKNLILAEKYLSRG